MDERLKDIQKKVVDFWQKYDRKQKTLIISITAVVIIALVIMAMVLTTPRYESELITCNDTVEAADVTSLLSAEGIEYRAEENGLRIMVQDKDLITATYLIAQNGLTATAYTMEAYTADSSFSTTSTDRDRQYQKYLEDKMRITLENFEFVKSADVMFTLPDKKLTVLETDEETYVSVKLTLKKSVPEGAAAGMANYIKTAVGNDTTNSITIIDSQGNTLFSGSTNYAGDDVVSLDYRTGIEERFNNRVTNNVYAVLMKTGLYSDIAVSPALDISFSKDEKIVTEYWNPDEVIDNYYHYESEGVSGTSGVPGTDSNDDDTTYYIDTGDGTSTTVSIDKTQFAVSSTITSYEGDIGTCDYDASTMAVTVNRYEIHNEDTLRAAGVLDDISWEEYIANNSEPREIEVDEDLKTLVSMATNIPEDSIKIVGYIIPMFETSEGDGDFIQTWLPIIVAVLILVLLGFMVWRSLRPVEINEIEPELSVEELLSATREKQQPVEDIDLEEKSETRKAIEKFVDENPESAALLLRNWLNDDWD